MNIVHVINSLELGGTENMPVKISSSQSFVRDKVVIISLKGIGLLSPEFENLDVKISYLRTDGFFSFFCSLWQISSDVRRFKPDIIHAWLYHSAIFSIFLKFLF